MGITNQLSNELEGIFNQWAKVRITDPEVKKLIQMALVPNKEVLQNIQTGKDDELSTCFKNMTDAAFEYAMTNESQQLETTKGSLFGAYNAVIMESKRLCKVISSKHPGHLCSVYYFT